MEKNEQKFCGVLLLLWEEWDDIDSDMIQLYNVEFPMESMKEHNGCDVTLTFDGSLEVLSADDCMSEPLWSGYVTDIPEIMEELNKKNK